MKRLIKKLARYILREEIKAKNDLIYMLRSYLKKHNPPELDENNEDNTDVINYHMDVYEHLYIPNGIFNVRSIIKIGDEV